MPRLSKKNASRLAILLAALLALSKLIIGFFSGSLAVLGSAMDSMFDVLASSVNYFMIKMADAPPDEEHNFGHGKFESYASILQSILIFSIGAFLFYEAFMHLRTGIVPKIDYIVVAVMVASVVVSLILTVILRRVGRREKSSALQADATHYSTDVITNIAVFIGLIVIKMTGNIYMDAIVGITIACYIMYSALQVHLNALRVLLDAKVPEKDLQEIKDVLNNYLIYIADYHRFRARTDGNKIFADLHLLLPREMTLAETHALCDLIESEMPKGVDITIHPETTQTLSESDHITRQSIIRLLEKKKMII